MYGLSGDDLTLQATAREFADELIPFELEAEMSRGELAEGMVDKQRSRAISLGLYATNMPTRLGGRGCTSLQQVLVQEQAGRVTNALGWVMGTPPAWWAEVASDYQLERWLLPTVRGEMSECYAITEADAGSDVAGIQSTARRDGDSYLLNGEKWHVTSYNEAGYAFFQAVLSDGTHAGEHALFVVDLPTTGVRVVRTPEYSHTIAHHHPIVAFEDVRVPASHLVGGEGHGMTFSYEWFRFERLMVAARCLGAAERLIEEATAFARDRVVSGEPLVQRQLVQAMLADSLTELFASRSMVYETAKSIDEGIDRKVAHARCAMVKLYASEMAGRVADRAVQIFGGRGYMRENVAERFYRELRVERIWEGASEVQRLVIADQLVKRGLSALI
ncbi:MAG: acyl-CoA dehydrogenase family protein [Nocardioidaceae bacterium]